MMTIFIQCLMVKEKVFIFSVLGLLNDDYEGGEFYMIDDQMT